MQEELNKIQAVIVLYNTALENCPTFVSLQAAIANISGCLELLIYNNSPTFKIDTTKHYDRISFHIIEDFTNPGVSKPYNIANEMARKKGKDWLLLLDQDCNLSPNLFHAFFSAKSDSAVDIYAPIIRVTQKILSPGHYFPYRGFLRKHITPGIYSLRKMALINCGLFVRPKTFDLCGGYNEDVKLDFSDFSFLNRFRKYCKSIYILDANCAHNFSGAEYSDLDAIKKRFHIYTENAIAFSKEKSVSSFFLNLTVLVRTLNLSIRFRTLYFIKKFKLL